MIVVDEIHMLTDKNRGFLLEVILSKIKFLLHEKVQIIGMSATLPNISDLSGWLGASLFSTEFRPVDLSVRICMGKKLFKVLPSTVDTTSITKSTTLPKNSAASVYGSNSSIIKKLTSDHAVGSNIKASVKIKVGNRNETVMDIEINSEVERMSIKEEVINIFEGERADNGQSNDICQSYTSNMSHYSSSSGSSGSGSSASSSSSSSSSGSGSGSGSTSCSGSDSVGVIKIVCSRDTACEESEADCTAVRHLPLSPPQPLPLPLSHLSSSSHLLPSASTLPIPFSSPRRSVRHRPACLTQNTNTNTDTNNNHLNMSSTFSASTLSVEMEILPVPHMPSVTESAEEMNICEDPIIIYSEIVQEEQEFDPSTYDLEYDRDVPSTESMTSPNFDYLEYESTAHSSTHHMKDPEGLFFLCLEPLFRGKSVMLFCPSKRRCEICAVEIANIIKTIPILNSSNSNSNSSSGSSSSNNSSNSGGSNDDRSTDPKSTPSNVPGLPDLPDKSAARTDILNELRLAPVRLCEVNLCREKKYVSVFGRGRESKRLLHLQFLLIFSVLTLFFSDFFVSPFTLPRSISFPTLFLL